MVPHDIIRNKRTFKWSFMPSCDESASHPCFASSTSILSFSLRFMSMLTSCKDVKRRGRRDDAFVVAQTKKGTHTKNT